MKTYRPIFSEKVNEHAMTFVDYDRTVLKEATNYPYGTPAADVVRPDDPTRASNDLHSYTFSGWEPEVADVTGPAVYMATYKEGPLPPPAAKQTLTFDCAGGTIDGKTTLTIEASDGDVITIPEAPVRAGYTFKYWKGSEHHPGDKYTAEGDHRFTAVWEKDAGPAPAPEPKKGDATPGAQAANGGTPAASGQSAQRSAISKTGDVAFLGFAVALSCLAVGAAALGAVSIRRKRQGR